MRVTWRFFILHESIIRWGVVLCELLVDHKYSSWLVMKHVEETLNLLNDIYCSLYRCKLLMSKWYKTYVNYLCQNDIKHQDAAFNQGLRLRSSAKLIVLKFFSALFAVHVVGIAVKIASFRVISVLFSYLSRNSISLRELILFPLLYGGRMQFAEVVIVNKKHWNGNWETWKRWQQIFS